MVLRQLQGPRMAPGTQRPGCPRISAGPTRCSRGAHAVLTRYCGTRRRSAALGDAPEPARPLCLVAPGFGGPRGPTSQTQGACSKQPAAPWADANVQQALAPPWHGIGGLHTHRSRKPRPSPEMSSDASPKESCSTTPATRSSRRGIEGNVTPSAKERTFYITGPPTAIRVAMQEGSVEVVDRRLNYNNAKLMLVRESPDAPIHSLAVEGFARVFKVEYAGTSCKLFFSLETPSSCAPIEADDLWRICAGASLSYSNFGEAAKSLFGHSVEQREANRGKIVPQNHLPWVGGVEAAMVSSGLTASTPMKPDLFDTNGPQAHRREQARWPHASTPRRARLAGAGMRRPLRTARRPVRARRHPPAHARRTGCRAGSRLAHALPTELHATANRPRCRPTPTATATATSPPVRPSSPNS